MHTLSDPLEENCHGQCYGPDSDTKSGVKKTKRHFDPERKTTVPHGFPTGTAAISTATSIRFAPRLLLRVGGSPKTCESNALSKFGVCLPYPCWSCHTGRRSLCRPRDPRCADHCHVLGFGAPGTPGPKRCNSKARFELAWQQVEHESHGCRRHGFLVGLWFQFAPAIFCPRLGAHDIASHINH